MLETGLSNINAIFHPPGMIMNAGWIQHSGGDFLFYREGFTDAVARVTAAVDAERMAVAKALGIPAIPFLDFFYQAELTTKAARDSGDISRACRESEPNKTIKSLPLSITATSMKTWVTALFPLRHSGRLRACSTPTIAALVQLAALALGIDYMREGLTLEKLGLAGKSASELLRLVEEGRVILEAVRSPHERSDMRVHTAGRARMSLCSSGLRSFRRRGA